MISNPFAADVYPDGFPVEGAAALHGQVLALVGRLMKEAERASQGREVRGGGAVLLLKAPRAGFGKSHLLAQLAVRAEGTAFVVAPSFEAEEEPQWSAFLWQVLGYFHSQYEGDVRLLDLVGRRVCALANGALLRSGKVPCPQPEEAVERLDQHYVRMFDFTDDQQPVARWFAEHFDQLLPWASGAVAEMAGISDEAASHWLRVLCAYGQAGTEPEAVRWQGLRWSVMEPSAAATQQGGMTLIAAPEAGEVGAKQRLLEFFRIAGLVRPLAVLLDDLDAYFQKPAAIQRLAGMVATLRQKLPRAVTVLSVNQDLWAQSFLKALPSAVEDRLTGRVMTLGGATLAEGVALLQGRLEAAQLDGPAAQRVMDRLQLPTYFAQEAGRLVSARGLLRYAAQIWEDSADARAAESTADSVRSLPVAPISQSSNTTQEVTVDPFERLRQKLAQLKAGGSRTIFDSGPVPGASGAIISAPPQGDALDAVTPAPAPVAVAPLTAAEIVASRYRQLVTHFSTSPWLIIDHERLYHLVEEAGRRMAVVRWTEFPVPGLTNLKAGAWITPEAEIIFGTESADDQNYWGALNHFVRQRATQISTPCRLVVFSSVQMPVNLSLWMPPDEIISARSHYLDLQPLDRTELAALYAGDEVLRDAARGALPLNPQETFSQIASSLEFLWKRLTRLRSSGTAGAYFPTPLAGSSAVLAPALEGSAPSQSQP